MSKTVSFVGIFALAAIPALAQSSSTGSGQTSGSGTNSGSGTGTSSTSASSGKSGSAAGSVAASDRKFVTEAAHGGLAEVELGQLATQKASNADVKSFGQMMVDDHTKANDELKTLASGKGITLPSALDAKDKATKARLEKLSGDQFDKAYMETMVKDHKTDIAEFKHAASSAKDSDLKSFADKTLPTLEKHLQKAEQTASAVGASTSGGKSGAAGTSSSGSTSGSKSSRKGSTSPGR